MKIKVIMTPNIKKEVTTILLDDLGFTKQEWVDLDEESKECLINEHLAELPEQPYWMVDKFEEKY